MNVLDKFIAGVEPISGVPGLPVHASRKLGNRVVNASAGSSIYKIDLPEKLESQTYGALMKNLAAKGILAIGLLRGLIHKSDIGPKANSMVYVYTNPNVNTEVYSCDRVFVLSQTVLSSGPNSSDTSVNVST